MEYCVVEGKRLFSTCKIPMSTIVHVPTSFDVTYCSHGNIKQHILPSGRFGIGTKAVWLAERDILKDEELLFYGRIVKE